MSGADISTRSAKGRPIIMRSLEAIHPYSRLTPDAVLNALESLGLRCDGRLLALNSYENRVYQVGLE